MMIKWLIFDVNKQVGAEITFKLWGWRMEINAANERKTVQRYKSFSFISECFRIALEYNGEYRCYILEFNMHAWKLCEGS